MKTLRTPTPRMGKALLAFVLLAFAVLASLPTPLQAQESRLEAVVKRGTLVVATNNTNPPHCFTNEKGELVGFDIDIARIIAKALLGDEKKVEFVPVTSEGRWPAVLSGKADFGIADTTIYPDRALRVAFTRPYEDSSISVLVRKDANVNTVSELNNEKFTLANLSNPQMHDRAKRYLPKLKILTFDTPSAMYLAVQSGQATAMQMDTQLADWYALQNNDLKVLPDLLTNVQNNAIFMKPGDFTWWLYLDTIVGELRTGSLYDQYAATFRKWFGKDPPPSRFYTQATKG
ncbi:transporter substrate-binding domain-containing protein [Bradyrhizobium sp. CCGUVB23]|uniref:transporter substrate-binding domain-containing protein n=1 Tax=Bradyrhizobium sp. CCGUVB23 TaxID=2949630 RepID=UPI0020B45A59|nr:transporter substrate-binding domain-containing protein [Bradyrhizobium sp. CCGUVB23]MCP3463529.1 transporter substrate-binding domain-containing protein [Bradyrhizobium sp. CCGUVB23]